MLSHWLEHWVKRQNAQQKRLMSPALYGRRVQPTRLPAKELPSFWKPASAGLIPGSVTWCVHGTLAALRASLPVQWTDFRACSYACETGGFLSEPSTGWRPLPATQAIVCIE